MPRFLLLLSFVLTGLVGCSDAQIRDTAQCDGVLNTVEATVDDAFDTDGDGYFDADNAQCAATYAPEELDCDDGDGAVNPGAQEEVCNGLDDDCDGSTDDAPDADGDGVTPCEGDCDDHNDAVHAGLTEETCDGLDNDCSTATPDGVDGDGDGYTDCEDCDDDNDAVNPATAEVDCNGWDDDCNEATPDGEDFDSDGMIHCFDCDDADPSRFPGNPEVCEDGIDNDCDGSDAVCPPPTWDGIWSLDGVGSPFSCGLGNVEIDPNSVSVTDNSPQISFTFLGSAQPGTLSGTLSGTSFDASLTIGGGCTEEYLFSGSFTSETTFAGTLQANFIEASPGWCFDCSNQTWSVTGAR